MHLKNAIALLKRHGTNYREYIKSGSQHYAADVNGCTIAFWHHVTNPDEASACIIQEVGGDKACFSGKGLTTTIRRCLADGPKAAIPVRASENTPKAVTKEKDRNEVSEIVALGLATVYADESTTLVSLKHRAVVADFDGEHPQVGIPHLHLDGEIEERAGKAYWKDGWTDDEGFPGWSAVFDLIAADPSLLSRKHYPAKHDYLDGVCPDCGEPIADDAEGDSCSNCDHVFSRPRPNDD
jgi:hypothetical protein